MKFAVLSQSGIRRYRVERAVQKLQAPQPRNPWRALSPSSKLRMKDWTCRSTFAAPRRNRPFASPAKRPTRPDRYIWPNSQSIAPTRHRAIRRRRLRRQCARGRDPLSPRVKADGSIVGYRWAFNARGSQSPERALPWQRNETLPRNAISVSRSLPRRSVSWLAGLLNLDSRPLTGNSVRRAGSNSPPRSGPRPELRCEPGPDSVHSFFGRFERSSPGGGGTRKVHFSGRAGVFAA